MKVHLPAILIASLVSSCDRDRALQLKEEPTLEAAINAVEFDPDLEEATNQSSWIPVLSIEGSYESKMFKLTRELLDQEGIRNVAEGSIGSVFYCKPADLKRVESIVYPRLRARYANNQVKLLTIQQ